jgi:hypothetical protein
MSLETFSKIFQKFPKNLTQIAFGIGSIDANEDLWAIMKYCRENKYNKVVPNITINGYRMHEYYYWQLVNLCGAVAVSNYDKDTCYKTVERLTYYRDIQKENGRPGTLQQVNIHQLLCEETYDQCFDLMRDMQTDKRLEKLNAVVFLLLKPKGKRNIFHQIRSLDKYRKLINFALENSISIGFDSCTAPSFLKAIEGRDGAEQYAECCEPCESNCFSSYVNTEGRYFHCSFTEDQPGWDGIDMLQVDDFMTEVWNNPEVLRFRGKLQDSADRCGCRTCPIFDLEMK